MLKNKTDKLGPNTFEGRVVCTMGRAVLWDRNTGILRRTAKEALEDARKLQQRIRDEYRL